MVKPSRIDGFCDEISVPGLTYMKTDYKSWFRLITATLVILCIGIAIYQVVDRVQWYVQNPLIFTEKADNKYQYIQFPTIVVCNNMQMRATHIGQQNQDILETLSALKYNNNGSLRAEAVNLINSLADMQKTLAELSGAVSNVSHNTGALRRYYNYMTHFGNLTHDLEVLEGIPSFATQDQDRSFYEIKGKLQKSLTNTSSYLLFFPQDIENYYQRQANLSKFERAYVSSLLNFITDSQRKGSLQSCGWSWKCRLKAAADNLHAVANFDFQKLATESSQDNSELIAGCLFKGNEACKISKKFTKEGKCYEIQVDKKFGEVKTAGRDNSMNILMDLENYKAIPGFPFNLGAKIYIRSPIGNDARGENKIFITSGSHWNIGIGKYTEKRLHKSQCGQVRLKYFQNYSYEYCVWEKETDYLVEKCGCSSFYLPPNLKNSRETPLCDFGQQIGCFEKSLQAEVLEECPADCFTVTYEAEVTSTVLGAKTIEKLLPRSWAEYIRNKLSNYHRHVEKYSTDVLPTREKWLEFQHNFFDLWISFAPISSQLNNLSSTVTAVTKDWPVNHCSEGQEPAYIHDSYAEPKYGCPADQNRCKIKCRAQHPHIYIQHPEASAVCIIQRCVCCRVLSPTEWDNQRVKSAFEHFSAVTDGVQRFIAGMKSHVEQFQNVNDGTGAANLCRSGSSFLTTIQKVWDDVRAVKSDRFGDFIKEMLASRYLEQKQLFLIDGRKEKMTDLRDNLLPSFFNLQNKTKNLPIAAESWFPELQQFCNDLQVFLPGEYYDRENIVMVTIYFKDLDQQQIVQSLSYDGFSLLAEIGGTLGLYLGATVLVFFQILVYLMKLLSKKRIIMKAKSEPEGCNCRNNKLEGKFRCPYGDKSGELTAVVVPH